MHEARHLEGMARPEAGTEGSHKAGPRPFALPLFAILLVSYAINAMDRQLFPLLASDVRREYGFSL